MVNLTDFEELARVKMAIKELEAQAKEIQKRILEEDNPPDKVKTGSGTLTKTSRATYNSINNEAYVEEFGQESFNTAATVSVSGVKKAFGEAGVTQLDTKGFLTVKSVSEYYTLRK